ncbi:protein masquerade [Drosophila willistoni]|uniref:protein masquerade n=1 Tax=Drosophila willistoni TaxID=7260 RepID=UPI001F07F478|nr:protein masquerade [Drosophila willistoni]
MTSQKVHKHKSEKKRSSSSSSQHKSHKLKSKHGEHHLKRKYLKKLRKGAQSISFPYQLFLYRQELRRSSSDFSYLRLSRAKIMLTSKLIANNINTYNQMSTTGTIQGAWTNRNDNEWQKDALLWSASCNLCLGEVIEEAERLGLSSTSETTRITTTTSTPTTTKTTATSTTTTKTTTTTTRRPISSTKPTLTTSKAKQSHKFDEDDYNFLSERLPDLSDDEYANLSEDANPLHFLKQQSKPQVKEQTTPETTTPIAMKSGSPIYITIPIYISTAGKLPLTLTIGDQEMPIHQLRRAGNITSKKNPSTKAPNSHFNRLLQQIESPKRRVTNRHRHSPTKSKIYAVKERHNN